MAIVLKVTFPETVKWMAVEFDPRCGTAQVEDSLQLSIPVLVKGSDQRLWHVLRKFSGTSRWPLQSVILPGNEVCFSLETASDYMKDEKSCFFGFKCTVVGYEYNMSPEEVCSNVAN
jgi:E3 ubiquitin-protein ligase MYCBP2